MDAVYIGASIVGGIVIGIIIEKALTKMREDKEIEREKLLEECFGEHIYAGTFSLAQMRDWVKSRNELLKNGAKAFAMKINDETLTKLGVQVQLGKEMENFLVIAILNEAEKNMVDSVLIKYENIDSQLDRLLEKGNGMVVIGG